MAGCPQPKAVRSAEAVTPVRFYRCSADGRSPQPKAVRSVEALTPLEIYKRNADGRSPQPKAVRSSNALTPLDIYRRFADGRSPQSKAVRSAAVPLDRGAWTPAGRGFLQLAATQRRSSHGADQLLHLPLVHLQVRTVYYQQVITYRM